ncbi:MAG: phospholipase D family protein [Clostridium sp.]|nr:phospholipase D family protein [Clostridium sp.]
MLNPNNRQLYLSALSPPNGYEFASGIATTFSLDLLTLLVAPVSLALAEFQNESEIKLDLVAVLESLRRTTDKLAFFCQAGRIQIPKVDNLLYSYLERTVVEVQPPDPNGVFHPKIWLLRFISPDSAPMYRFICLTRNLTFDQSWDTILVLEGEVAQNRSRGFSVNRPLTDFIKNLPDLAVTTVGNHISRLVKLIVEDLPRVQFKIPESFNSLSFRPIGIPGYGKMKIKPANRLLVISPFLSDWALQLLATNNKESILISRIDSLVELEHETLDCYSRIYFFDDIAVEPTEEEESEIDIEESPKGLHAKLFLSEHGHEVSLWTGSANATDPVFKTAKNVEFMVELTGAKRIIGIDQILEEGEDSLSSLISLYITNGEPKKPDPTLKQLEMRLDSVRRSLITAGLKINVTTQMDQDYSLTLDSKVPINLLDVECRCWPITLNMDIKAQKLTDNSTVKIIYNSLSLESITSFIAFELTAFKDGQKKRLQFVINLPISGIPESRQERILHKIISDRGSFIRYLLLLLAEGGSFQPELFRELVSGKGSNTSKNDLMDIPLFEELVRALSRHPEKIDRVNRLVQDIAKSELGRHMLPEGFTEIWAPIIEARKKVAIFNE